MFLRTPQTSDEAVKWRTQRDDANCPESCLKKMNVFALHATKSHLNQWLNPEELLLSHSKENVLSYDTAAAAAKSLQSCPTLWDPIDGSPPGSPVPGVLQARTLEWVAISFSNAWKWKVKVKSLSCVWLPATPWTAAHQAPPSMGFSRQGYWGGLPWPSPVLW